MMEIAQNSDLAPKPPLRVCSVGGMLFLINSIRETDQYIADIYKMERKTHPSFLRGWDVSDKDSELTL